MIGCDFIPDLDGDFAFYRIWKPFIGRQNAYIRTPEDFYGRRFSAASGLMIMLSSI